MADWAFQMPKTENFPFMPAVPMNSTVSYPRPWEPVKPIQPAGVWVYGCFTIAKCG